MANMVLAVEGGANMSKEDISKAFDEEIEKFSNYMATLGDWKVAGPLTPAERALVKTYLVQKYAGRLDKEK